MPIPPELHQAFQRLQQAEEMLNATMLVLQQTLAVAKGAIDEIRAYHEPKLH